MFVQTLISATGAAISRAVDEQLRAAVGQQQRLALGLDLDRPVIVVVVAPVHNRSQFGARRCGAGAESERRSDRRSSVFRILSVGRFHEHRPRRDLREDGQRIDPGIEHAEIPCFQIQSWPGCQRRTFSCHSMCNRFRRQPARRALRLVDGGVVLRMPGREDRSARLARSVCQIVHFGDRRRGRLLQHNVFAGRQSLARERVAHMRRVQMATASTSGTAAYSSAAVRKPERREC